MNGPFKVVIPARHASTRLPGKPLADIGGVPMIVRVARQAQAAGADEVVVATDDDRVVAATVAAGFRALMTRADHPSGSDRVMEVAERLGWNDATCVVNVQGDEPLLPPAVIACVAGLLQSDAGVRVATLCEPITDYRTLFNPNVVKVARAHNHDALYFSRAPIPFARDAFARTDFPAAPDTSAALVPGAAGALPAAGIWLRHIGIYGFRLEALRRFVALPVGTLERLEALEQLRMLEHGIAIRVAETPVPVPGGVDTPEDLERVRRALAGAAASG